MAGDILDRKDQIKLRLGIYFFENFEISYGWGFFIE